MGRWKIVRHTAESQNPEPQNPETQNPKPKTGASRPKRAAASRAASEAHSEPLSAQKPARKPAQKPGEPVGARNNEPGSAHTNEAHASERRRALSLDGLTFEVQSLSQIEGLGAEEEQAPVPRSSLEVSERLSEKRRAARERAAARMAERRGTATDPLLEDLHVRGTLSGNWSKPDWRVQVCAPDRMPPYAFMALEHTNMDARTCFRRVLTEWSDEEIDERLLGPTHPGVEETLQQASEEDLDLALHVLSGGVALIWAQGPPGQPPITARADDLYRWSWGLALKRRNRVARVVWALRQQVA